MKQHITPEQLNDLDMKMSNRLDDWWGKLSDESKKGTVYSTVLGISTPLLSIGQMIEFLDERTGKKEGEVSSGKRGQTGMALSYGG